LARKSKLTAKMIERIAGAIEKGMPAATVCRGVGIAPKTYYDWLKKGRDNYSPIYKRFLIAIDKANLKAEEELLQIIKKHSTKQWQAAAWIMERRFRDRWGREGYDSDKGKPDDSPVDEEFL